MLKQGYNSGLNHMYAIYHTPASIFILSFLSAYIQCKGVYTGLTAHISWHRKSPMEMCLEGPYAYFRDSSGLIGKD